MPVGRSEQARVDQLPKCENEHQDVKKPYEKQGFVHQKKTCEELLECRYRCPIVLRSTLNAACPQLPVRDTLVGHGIGLIVICVYCSDTAKNNLTVCFPICRYNLIVAVARVDYTYLPY